MGRDLAFGGDAYDYNRGAINMVTMGMYSLDGVSPTMEREPGQSTFLALIYLFFGIENYVAVFIVQGILFLIASLLFVREVERTFSSRVAAITLALLFIAPSIYHTIFSVYRENFALSQLLLFSALFFSFMRRKSLAKAVGLGILFGAVIFTYFPFIFFPLFLLILLVIERVEKKYMALIVCVPFLLVSLWCIRNYQIDGQFRFSGEFRSTAMWHARGEQAEHLRGFDAFECLWAEYISRDWSELPCDCSTNCLINTKWHNRIPTGEEAAIAATAKQEILRNFPHYIVFSVFEVLELHLPYVNGWGFWYNVLTALSTVVFYSGCFLAIPVLRHRRYWFFLVFIFYATAVFSLTDATPRYLIPIIFCYAALGAVGYDHAWRLFVSRRS